MTNEQTKALYAASQKCINKIDDFFEYRAARCSNGEIKAHVMRQMDLYTIETVRILKNVK